MYIELLYKILEINHSALKFRVKQAEKVNKNTSIIFFKFLFKPAINFGLNVFVCSLFLVSV